MLGFVQNDFGQNALLGSIRYNSRFRKNNQKCHQIISNPFHPGHRFTQHRSLLQHDATIQHESLEMRDPCKFCIAGHGIPK